jgi:hypothetical protein
MNLHAMNLLTIMMAANDLMLVMVESVKSKEWPNGLAYILWEKLIKKFKLSDQVAKAEQTAKLLSLKLKKGEDQSELELRIALLEAMYGILLNKEIVETLRISPKSESESVKSVRTLKSESVQKSLLNLSEV